MKICKKQAIVIYGTSTERISSVLGSGIFRGCNIVALCTDELILGDANICEIPVIQMDEVNFQSSPIIILLDENIPDVFKKVAIDNGISMYNLEDITISDDESADEVYNGTENTSADDKANDIGFVDEHTYESEAIDGGAKTAVSADEKQNSEIAEESGKNPVCFPAAEAEEIRKSLVAGLEKIYQAINNTKSKDASIYNINKELQKFKDGYYGKLTSPIISEIITLREDYKKSIADFSKFGLNYDKLANYLECTIDQIDEILVTYDVMVNDGKYSYNGKVIYPTGNEFANAACVESEYAEIEKETHTPSASVNEINDCSSLENFLVNVSETIGKLLQNNEALIKSIELQHSDLKKQMAVTDGLLIIPLLRKIIRMKLAFVNKLEMLADFKEEAEEIYKEAYEYGIMYAESILMSLGVSIRSNIDDIYDPKYHRILKMQKILPEEAEKDKHIAVFLTDCYINNERVIAPAKVIAYRL